MENIIQPELLITETALAWLQKTHQPFCFTDFMGYIFVLDVKKSVAASIDVFGDIKIFSCDKNRMLSIKKVQKYIKKLVKSNFLEIGYEPFPEFSNRKNIKINPAKVIFMEEPLFGKLNED